jgi:hypothetical protein
LLYFVQGYRDKKLSVSLYVFDRFTQHDQQRFVYQLPTA